MSYFPQLSSKGEYRLVSSPAGTNVAVVKNAPATVLQIVGANINAAPRYLKLFDTATAPTLGADVPRVTIMIPGQDTVPHIPAIEFKNGVAIAITAMGGDLSTAGISDGDIIGLNIFFR